MDYMKNNEVFTYRYSAKENKEIEEIRRKYRPREKSKLDLLRQMDSRVQSAGMVEGLTVGITGCLIFGIGLCFGLDVLDGADWLSPLLCGIGTLVMLPAYPVYKHISEKTKKKLTPEILRLTEEILKS